jgi:hypothetical protein
MDCQRCGEIAEGTVSLRPYGGEANHMHICVGCANVVWGLFNV